MTATKTYTFVDKSTWGEGAWQHEPDKVVWIDGATGLDCMARRNARLGQWCGYVGVPPEHPWHGRDMHDDLDLDVHGGITFTDRCEPSGNVEAICHIPEPGRPADVWWFGFDCGHFRDLHPGMVARMRAIAADPATDEETRQVFAASPFEVYTTYKTLDYVRDEVVRLAAQLAEVATIEEQRAQAAALSGYAELARQTPPRETR